MEEAAISVVFGEDGRYYYEDRAEMVVWLREGDTKGRIALFSPLRGVEIKFSEEDRITIDLTLTADDIRSLFEALELFEREAKDR
jgi:hypothetical protein